MRPTPGGYLAGRYRFVELIALGGMGEVWLAHDESLGRDVAIKILREELTGDTDFIERFRTEARLTAGLSHRGIAAFYDYGETDGSAYLVMELVIAEPLSATLERERRLSPRHAIPILSQTAHALHAAHLKGVVHRDVKPGNILVDEQGKVKITDFGISRATGDPSLTAVGMIMGTAQYLAPEQVAGHPASPSSDIYALGVVAFEVLAGRRPFTGATPLEIATQHAEAPVPPLPRHVPLDLAELVHVTLAKRPNDRPRTAHDLAEALDACAQRLAHNTGEVFVPSDVFSRGRVFLPDSARPPTRSAIPTAARITPGAPAAEALYPPAPSRGKWRQTVSTWTGQRLSWLSPPLIALILLVVFAVVGSMVAGRLFAAGSPMPPHGGAWNTSLSATEWVLPSVSTKAKEI